MKPRKRLLTSPRKRRARGKVKGHETRHPAEQRAGEHHDERLVARQPDQPQAEAAMAATPAASPSVPSSRLTALLPPTR